MNFIRIIDSREYIEKQHVSLGFNMFKNKEEADWLRWFVTLLVALTMMMVMGGDEEEEDNDDEAKVRWPLTRRISFTCTIVDGVSLFLS